MQKNNKGKYRALLGVLVVFVVPFLVVSTVYLSSKPKTVTLETYYEGKSFMKDSLETKTNEYIDFSKLDKDIKILFLNDLVEQNEESFLKNIYSETLTYPERDFKDPFPKILFVSFHKEDRQLENQLGDKNSYLIEFNSIKDSIIANQLSEQKVLLLGRENRVRGQYAYTEESFQQFKKDLQNLMAETYFVNKKTERKTRLNKKL